MAGYAIGLKPRALARVRGFILHKYKRPLPKWKAAFYIELLIS
jgi:hypothetical protein